MKGCIVKKSLRVRYTLRLCNAGAGGGSRTHNLRFRRPLLYPLSYARLLTFDRDTSNIAYACPADKPERPPESILMHNRIFPLTGHVRSGIVPFRNFQEFIVEL